MPQEKLDKVSITEQLEQLQLEETQERITQMRERKESMRRRLESRQIDIRNGRARQKAQEDACWHKKGGKGVEMLSRGNDHNYAVVKHQLCHGPIIIICQRCSKVVEPPDQALNRKKATPEQKAEYKRLYADYQWWLNLPTDNEMSGTQLFVIHRDEDAA
jgi:TolA-binding protein